jgi:peptidyl-prolyl cis-trans isomerase D
MAVLQKIRNRAGVLIAIFVGVALVFFIIDPQILDFISFKNQKEAGEINDKVITWENFDALVNQHSQVLNLNTKQQEEQAKEGVWQELVRARLLEDEYKDLGIRITEDEFNELTTGRNPHPFVMQQVRNPQTGQFDRTFLMNIRDQVDQNQEIRAFWYYLRNQLFKIRRYEKFNMLVSKGFYANSLEAKEQQQNMTKKVNFSYVVKRYATVSDSSISFSENEIKKYYNEHKEEYKQEESRDIEFVIFRLDPSEDDTRKVIENISNIRAEFETADSNKVQRMIRLESDVRYEDLYYKDGDLSPMINDTLFSITDTGAVIGPYFEEEAYKLSKLLEITMGADSAHARHILIRPKAQTMEAYEAAEKRIDSIKTAINEGTDFVEMAMQFSEDPGSQQNGGDLGWFSQGQMVKPFEDASFYNKAGSLVVVNSQFGVHLIEVLERGTLTKRVKVANIVKRVEPSKETINRIHTKASDFAYNNQTVEEFRKAAENDPQVQLKTANNLNRSSSYIPDISFTKPVLGWAFDAEKNQVTKKPISNDDMYIVAAVTEIRKEGYAPVDQVRLQIEAEVIKEKKGNYIKSQIGEKISGMNDLEGIADKLSLLVEEETGVSFAQSSIKPGPEPKIIAWVHYLSPETISEPIIGENGVYIVQVNSVEESSEQVDVELAREQLQRNYSAGSYYFYEGLMDEADIVDNRLTRYYRK